MNNKFEKAIEKREKEEETKPETTKKEEKVEEKEEKAPESVLNLDVLIKKEERRGENKNLYLDKEILKRIKQEAKKRKTSESKVVNEILKAVFGIE